MNSRDLEAAVAEVATPQPSRSRQPLPCRAVVAGPFSPEILQQQLSSLAVPARTVALLTGNLEGPGAVDAVVVRWAHARTQALVGSLRSGEVRLAAYRHDVSALTGLGPGLTPTGDDLLVGIATMARRLRDVGLVESRAAGAFAAALTGLPSSPTSPVALALLENASKEIYPSVLVAVVELLGSPDADPDTLGERVALLTAVGAHSGADLLAGALSLVLGVVFPREAP
jgi:hypothetical protein